MTDTQAPTPAGRPDTAETWPKWFHEKTHIYFRHNPTSQIEGYGSTTTVSSASALTGMLQEYSLRQHVLEAEVLRLKDEARQAQRLRTALEEIESWHGIYATGPYRIARAALEALRAKRQRGRGR